MYTYTDVDEVKKVISVYFNRFGKRVMKDKDPTKLVLVIQFYLSLLQNNKLAFDLKP